MANRANIQRTTMRNFRANVARGESMPFTRAFNSATRGTSTQGSGGANRGGAGPGSGTGGAGGRQP